MKCEAFSVSYTLKSGEMYSCIPSGCITNPSRDSQAGAARSSRCLATWTYNCKPHFPCTHFLEFSNAFQLCTKPWVESSCLAFTTYADTFIKNFVLFASIKCWIWDWLQSPARQKTWTGSHILPRWRGGFSYIVWGSENKPLLWEQEGCCL